MKKPTKKPKKRAPAPSSPERESFYLERLCEELEHGDAARRDGARAALVWLGELVHHYAQTRAKVSRGSRRTLPEAAARPLPSVTRQLAVASLEAENILKRNEPPASATIEQRVATIERSILEREQERRIAREDGEADFKIVLN